MRARLLLRRTVRISTVRTSTVRISTVLISTVLAVSVAAGSARANVGLLPIAFASVDVAKAAELRASLDVELAGLLKRRQIKVAPTHDCAEGFDEACTLAIALASKTPLDEVALIGVEGAASGGFVVDISVRETSEGRRVFHEIVRQEPTDGPGAVGAALRRAFVPRSWAGRVVVEGAPPDAEVLVDGLRVTGPVVARVGPHRVQVLTADGARQVYDVEVSLGEVTAVAFLPPAAPPAPSLLPSLIIGGVGVIGLGAGASFGGLGMWLRYWDVVHIEGDAGNTTRSRFEFIATSARAGGANMSYDPIGGAWADGYGSADGATVTDASLLVQRAHVHRELSSDQALTTAYVIAAVVSGVVVVASGVGAFLAWPAAPDETSGDEALASP